MDKWTIQKFKQPKKFKPDVYSVRRESSVSKTADRRNVNKNTKKQAGQSLRIIEKQLEIDNFIKARIGNAEEVQAVNSIQLELTKFNWIQPF